VEGLNKLIKKKKKAGGSSSRFVHLINQRGKLVVAVAREEDTYAFEGGGSPVFRNLIR